jgi:probable blue pigment (indigoidine) exporter
MNRKIIWIGIAFAFLWASASSATKISLLAAQPFVIAITRFFIAGIIMLWLAHGFMRKRLPLKKEWRQIMIYGLLNISIYLGVYLLAMQRISAGLGSLAVAINPVMISFIAAALYGHRVTWLNITSLALCTLGVIIAAWPLLQHSYASIDGLMLLLVSMLAYSAGAIYYAHNDWGDLDILTINGWQTILGGVFLLPVLVLTFNAEKNDFDANFWAGTLWLAIPVSIGAVQCWLLLLNKTPLTAAYWLFLCPVFGFMIANLTLKEPISLYTLIGVLLVVGGLYIVQRFKQPAIKEPSLLE